MLPVELPEITDFEPRILADDVPTRCPSRRSRARPSGWRSSSTSGDGGCSAYRRETNTMPQWAGSCWYYLRYLDPTNEDALVDPEVERVLDAVDGSPTAASTSTSAASSTRCCTSSTRASGTRCCSTSGTCRRPSRSSASSTRAHPARRVHRRARHVRRGVGGARSATAWFSTTASRSPRTFGKMGKSLKNAVAPDDIYRDYGADTLRLYEMFTGPLDAQPAVEHRRHRRRAPVPAAALAQRRRRGHRRVARRRRAGRRRDPPRAAPHDRRGARRHGRRSSSTPRSRALIELQQPPHAGRAAATGARRARSCGPMVLMLAPLAPHIAEELWARLGHADTLAYEPFPSADPALLVDDTVEIPVQVNGKVRGQVTRRRPAPTRPSTRPRRAPTRASRSCSTARPSARSSSCPAASSTSSSADSWPRLPRASTASTPKVAICFRSETSRYLLRGLGGPSTREGRPVRSLHFSRHFLRGSGAPARRFRRCSRMVQQSRQPSREEQEFWDAQFRDPPRPRRESRRESAARAGRPDHPFPAANGGVRRWPKRGSRGSLDRCRDWRHDARFGVVVLVGVALVAGVIWYRIGIGGASAGESGAAPAAVSTTAPSTTLVDPTPTDAAATPSGAKGQAATIVVHVAGAVNHPGVVELQGRRARHRRGRGRGRRARRRRPRPPEPRGEGRRRSAGLRGEGRAGGSRRARRRLGHRGGR